MSQPVKMLQSDESIPKAFSLWATGSRGHSLGLKNRVCLILPEKKNSLKMNPTGALTRNNVRI